MRGKVYMRSGISALEGITPAHAGKSFISIELDYVDWDHPRTCGEKRFDVIGNIIYKGSPPHMRGKAALLWVLELYYRITPAHAGKS